MELHTMSTQSVKDQIMHELDRLTQEQQEHLLAVARRLQTSPLPPGVPGEVLIQRRHEFDFTPEDLEEVSRAIEEDCERIDWNDWQ